MTIELRQARAEDVPELGRVCYEAFKDISDRHGFATDFETVEFAQQIVGMLVQQEDVYGVAAFEGGIAKGSNYMEMWDDVAGVGPVSVDVASRAASMRGVGLEEFLCDLERKERHERQCDSARYIGAPWPTEPSDGKKVKM